MSRKKIAPVEQTAAESRKLASGMAAVFEDRGPPRAADYIKVVRAVPTRFPYFDWKTGVGGLPVGRVVVVHGPSNEGKTELCLGLLASYLDVGHAAALADAEHTTPQEFARSRMGEAAFTSPAFRSLPIGTYDDFRGEFRRFVETVAEARVQRRVPEDATALVVVDALKNLLPANVFEELQKSSRPGAEKGKGKYKRKGGVDGFGGRAGQLQAQYNTAWFIELSSLLHDTQTTAVIIVREVVEEGEGFYAEDTVKLVGGREVRFGNSLQLRVLRQPILEGEEKTFVGERHTVEQHKTKVARREEVVPRSYFHTSNGVASPEGFDRARDVFELGVDIHAVEQAGAWYSFGGEKLGQGAARAIEKLRDEPAVLSRVEAECRARFGLKKE